MLGYFAYGPNRELVKQTDIRDDDTTVRYLFGGYEVVELPSGATEHRMHVGGTVITHTESAQGVSTELLFMHTDVQGSTVLITANVSFGDVLRQQLNYDPWGKQALIYTSSQFITGRSLGDSHGYTGHTMVNDFKLVHMGGRTYNPVLGRFMQADPFIQAGANLQNYNRYSYVLNNPMSYTDPSGYLFKALKDNWRTLASIALTVLVPGMGFVQGLNLSAGGVGALTGFISGAVATGSLRGAVIGALTGSMFGGLSELGNTLPGVIGHGLVGGMSSMVQGGEFQAGFLSAGLVKAASVAGIMPAVGDNTPRERVANAIVAGTIGGTVSVAAGGKFANGAVTAALARAMAEGAEKTRYQRSKKLVPLSDEARSAFEPQFQELKKAVKGAGRFASSDNAANWLHENVHSKLKVDVEVGAFIYQSGEEFYIGELQTDYMTNSVNLNMTGQAHASWHSHGTHKGLYWRPTLQDVELDIGQELRWGYTSTTHNGNALWRFDVHGFNASEAPINWDTTRAHMCNLRREGDC